MKKYYWNPEKGSYESGPKHLSPSDIRRREKRKAERAALSEQGLLPRQRPSFRCFIYRGEIVEFGEKAIGSTHTHAIFESPNSQQDLNDFMLSHWIETPVEHSRNRLAVSAKNMELWAAELVSKGWVRL
jgi:hypothetical protein